MDESVPTPPVVSREAVVLITFGEQGNEVEFTEDEAKAIYKQLRKWYMNDYLLHALAFAVVLPIWMLGLIPLLLWWANRD